MPIILGSMNFRLIVTEIRQLDHSMQPSQLIDVTQRRPHLMVNNLNDKDDIKRYGYILWTTNMHGMHVSIILSNSSRKIKAPNSVHLI